MLPYFERFVKEEEKTDGYDEKKVPARENPQAGGVFGWVRRLLNGYVTVGAVDDGNVRVVAPIVTFWNLIPLIDCSFKRYTT